MVRGGGAGRDRRPEGSQGEPAVAAQRLDKWLWFARLAKTRTQAAALVTGGRIRVNRERVDKPGTTVKAGDVVTATLNRQVRVVRIAGFIDRRGPAGEAADLYEELTPAAEGTKSHARASPGSAAAGAEAPRHAERRPGAGRPTKRERRDLDRLKDPSL